MTDDSTPDDDRRPLTRREQRAAERTREAARRAAEAQDEQARAAGEKAGVDPRAGGRTPTAATGLPGEREFAGPARPGAVGGDPDSGATPDAHRDAEGVPPHDGAHPASPESTPAATVPHPAAAARRRHDTEDHHFADLLSGEHEVVPPERPRRRLRGLIIALVVVIVLAGAGVIAWNAFGERILEATGMSSTDYEGSGNGTEVDFSILSGDTGTSIGERLESAGVVKTSDAFISEVVSRVDEPIFQPGAYRLQERMSAEAALNALLDPANLLANTVVIPEGTVMADIFTLVEEATDITADELTAAAADPASYGLPAQATSLEGFLFPATYTFEPDQSARDVLQTMVDRMFQALDDQGVAVDQRWDVIRLASLVQKEARIDSDFPKIARVFLNRIAIGMPLQSDATVVYATGRTHDVTTTDAERADASNPYNTYVHPGLIVAPISNPGDVAISAALHPADGDWIYFVTWNLDTGETIYSTTYEEHEAAVAKWQAWMAEHPGY